MCKEPLGTETLGSKSRSLADTDPINIIGSINLTVGFLHEELFLEDEDKRTC